MNKPKPLTLMSMRDLTGVSQLEMASKLKVDQSSISRRENRSSRRLLLGSIVEYAKALGGSVEIKVTVDGETHAFSID